MNIFSNNYICALDLSSSKVAGVACKINKRKISEMFFESMPSRGIKFGSISDSIELISCVESIMKKLKEKSGINIKYVYVNISGQDIATRHSQAIIPLAERGNKVITISDIHKVNEQARILGSSLEEEIIDQIPFSYTLDSKNNIANPIGLYSHKLEVDLFLIFAKLASIQTLSRAMNQSGLEIKDLFFSSLATYQAVFCDNLKRGINVLCDIGSDITEILVFKDGLLKNIEILPIGGDDITLSLAEKFQIPPELAEDVKKSYASVQDAGRIDENKEILVKKNNKYLPIRQREVVESATASANEIAATIKEKIENIVEINKINNFIASGRTVLLEGFLEMLEANLTTAVKLGRINNPKEASILNIPDLSGQRYLTYLTCLGMISKALDSEQFQITAMVDSNPNPLSKILNKVKEVYLEYF